jgi:sporulation integral membrane protein YlbJ
MRPLFNVGGACSTAFVLGFVGGYPVGAKTVIALYENGSCSKAEAERMLSFCNNSGPAFILGVVGAGVFSSSKIGLLLYLVHTLSSVCIGILFRRWGAKQEKRGADRKINIESKHFTAAFTESVKSAFQSTLSICGFVIFFTVIIRLLFLSGLFPFLAQVIGAVFAPVGLDASWAERLLTGFIEISSGVWTLQGASGELTRSMAMAAFMLGWAGLSIHCQVLSFIGGSGLSVRTYIMGKILHGILSAALVFAAAQIFVFDAPVASYLAEQVTGIASMRFGSAVVISTVSAALIWIAFILFARKAAAKSGRRKKRLEKYL